MSFNDAKFDCQGKGANLTSVHSEEEQNLLACKLHVLVESSKVFDLFKVDISLSSNRNDDNDDDNGDDE